MRSSSGGSGTGGTCWAPQSSCAPCRGWGSSRKTCPPLRPPRWPGCRSGWPSRSASCAATVPASRPALTTCATWPRLGAALVVGGEGVVSDRYAEGEQAGGLNLVGVEVDGGDHLAKQGHAPVVHPRRNSATASSRRARSRTAGSMGRAAGLNPPVVTPSRLARRLNSDGVRAAVSRRPQAFLHPVCRAACVQRPRRVPSHPYPRHTYPYSGLASSYTQACNGSGGRRPARERWQRP